MSVDEMMVVYRKCPHGIWHSHNAVRLPDGTLVDTEPCPGGTATYDGQRVRGISHITAMALRDAEAALDGEET